VALLENLEAPGAFTGLGGSLGVYVKFVESQEVGAGGE